MDLFLKNKYFLAFLLYSIHSIVLSQTIVINEFVSSNNSVLQDIEGEFSDWIEIHNFGDVDVSLEGFKLSDNTNVLDKWTFPDVVIGANDYLLVFASNKDTIINDELHANFKISQSGEPLFLSNNEGEIVSETQSVYVPSDYSFARISDENSNMIISSTPSPNSINTIESGVACSHSSGFYSENFNLELFAANNEHQIYYTLNGEIPSINSTLYSGPITIQNVSESPNVFSNIPTTPLVGPYQLDKYIWTEPENVYKCNVVRFAEFSDGLIQGGVQSRTLFVDPYLSERYEFPIISLITDSLNLFDHDTGIYVPGKRFEEEGFGWYPQGNYLNGGEDWERTVHSSFFAKNGSLAFETDAGMRMKGFSSVSYPQKSINLFFRKRYGLNNINYKIFKNSQDKKYKRLVLRNSGNDFIHVHFRDAMLHELISTMDLEIQAFQPSIVFINGEYWGIHNLREKYDKYYFKYKFGIDEEDINLLNAYGNVKEGSDKDYKDLFNFIQNNDVTQDDNYDYVSTKLDISNFIDFQIAEIYFANYDWPCNNYNIWKSSDPGSKWRFLIYDLDMSFSSAYYSLYSVESMEHATSTASEWPYCSCSNLFFRKLLENETFKQAFISRFSFQMSNTFCPENVNKLIDEFKTLYENEIEEHIDRWNYPNSFENWENEVDILKEFANKRPEYMADNIRAFFDLEEFGYECGDQIVEVDNSNKISIFPNPNSGQFSVLNRSNSNIFGNVTLFNTMGQVVFEETEIPFAKNQSFEFNMRHLHDGIYHLVFEYNLNTLKQKLVIVSGS